MEAKSLDLTTTAEQARLERRARARAAMEGMGEAAARKLAELLRPDGASQRASGPTETGATSPVAGDQE